MNFEPHGRFDIQTLGQILRVQFWDNWNHEGVLQFFDSYKTAILSLGLPNFGVLTDMRTLTGATEKAIEYADVVVSWAIAHGQTCRAVLMESAYERYLVRKIIEDKDVIPTRSFQNEVLALEWLKGQQAQFEFNHPVVAKESLFDGGPRDIPLHALDQSETIAP